MHPSHVAVVGAGPVGLTAALLLARRGLAVTVLERQPVPYGLPRAVHLDGEAFRALQAAGVADEALRVSRPMAGLRLLDARLRTLAEFGRDPDAAPHGWPSDVLFHQPDLEQVLLAAVGRTPGVTVQRGAEVAGLRAVDGGVQLTLRGTGRTVEADAVLGCDGAGSTVRELIGARMRDLGRADRWLVVDARVPGLPAWPGVDQICDPHRAATFMRVTGDRYRWEFRLRPGEDGATSGGGRLAELLAPWHPGPLTVERVAEYTFRAQVADRWRHGRVLLAGDAAHLTPPFVGQGLGLGLRDVHQLTWKLADVLGGRAPDAVLDTHRAEREPHARALIRAAQLLGTLMTGGGAAGAVVRRGALAGVRRLPALAEFAAAGRTPALRSGPLVERRGRAGRALAGRLVPQPAVLLDGRPVPLDDVLGTGTAELRLLGGDRVAVHGEKGRREVRSPELAGWLRAAGAESVRIRPDRIVRSAG